MNFEELSQLIKSRRSVRNWQDKDVPDEVLKQALELATYAPSGMNYQGWKFVVVKNKDMINTIADAVRSRAQKVASWEETARHMENPQVMVERAGFFRKAPVLIAVYSQIYPSSRDQIYLERMTHDEEAALMKSWLDLANPRIQSIASAIAYLLLALHAQGLGSVWMTGPMQAKGDIEQLLGKPEGFDLVALIATGYPDETPRPKTMKSFDEVVQFVE
ncbi:MAG TPA: nitroreductase family protein [Coprothermobacter proteolyticus]|nr:nitroreductase family protein [Coprothermobacter proteolyticus]HOL53609.1 nitroreductase family protein [Coprothermobacter proteolyticus]